MKLSHFTLEKIMARYSIEREVHGGVQVLHRFENGYGASVVRHFFSYGSEDGLWELAVIKFKPDSEHDFQLVYDTPITKDVIGGLTEEQVAEYLKQIELLPEATHEPEATQEEVSNYLLA